MPPARSRFMDVWDAMCRTIMSAGHRRGAMMATMRCDHPDIEAFIEAKREPGRLRKFNLSVLVTDAFMAAVERGRAVGTDVRRHDLARCCRARDLWDKIMRATYAYAEPGVIFIDRINRRNNLDYCETISATNPCGEQPLPPYGACLLGSINLAALVEQSVHAGGAARHGRAGGDSCPIAVRLMDNVVDVSGFPLPQQTDEAKAKRRIGLGVTGLADALIMCGAALRLARGRGARRRAGCSAIQRAAYLASAELAAEKGAFPLYDAREIPGGRDRRGARRGRARRRSPRQRHPQRLLTSIAPTGTISLFADNVSSGIEPVFSFRYTRNVLMPDGTRASEEVADYAYRLFRQARARRRRCPRTSSTPSS